MTRSVLSVGIRLPDEVVDTSGVLPFVNSPAISVLGPKDESHKVTFRPSTKHPFKMAWWLGEKSGWWVDGRRGGIPGGEDVWEAWFQQADAALHHIDFDEHDDDDAIEEVIDAVMGGASEANIGWNNAVMGSTYQRLAAKEPDPPGYSVTPLSDWSGNLGFKFHSLSGEEDIEAIFWKARDPERRGWLDPEYGTSLSDELPPALLEYADTERARTKAAVRIAERWWKNRLLVQVGLTPESVTVTRVRQPHETADGPAI